MKTFSKRWFKQKISCANIYGRELLMTVFLANTTAKAKNLLHCLERAAANISPQVNANKTEYMCFYQTGDISTQNGSSLKLVDKLTYLGSGLSSTETDINTWLGKTRTAIDSLSFKWKSDLTDKKNRTFFQAAVLSLLLYGCTVWTLCKRTEKKLDDNYTRMLRSPKWQLYGYLPPITKIIQVRRHAGHCWRCKDGLISEILLWTLSHG